MMKEIDLMNIRNMEVKDLKSVSILLNDYRIFYNKQNDLTLSE